MRQVSALAFLAVALLAGVVLASAQRPRAGGETGAGSPFGLAAAGTIRVGNSEQGRAVLRALNLLPGQTRQGSVTISNPNRQPLELSLKARFGTGQDLARAIKLELTGPRGVRLYAGPLAALPRLPLAEMGPGASHRFTFRLGLPAGVGNELQSRSGSFDLVWSATAAGPPPQCRLRAMRSRFFVFRGRNRIRLVARYRAAVPGRVRVVFYERLRGGRIGRRVGRLDARFKRHRYRWGMIRVAHRRPPAEMRRFRRLRKGYVAQLWVAGTPGYCRQYLNLDLVQLKRFYRQYVWFQRGSFRTVNTKKR